MSILSKAALGLVLAAFVAGCAPKPEPEPVVAEPVVAEPVYNKY